MRLPALLAPLLCAVTAQSLAAPQPIRVPVGKPTPVLLDGQLSSGEWDDAAVVPITDSVRMLVKQIGGHVFLALASHTPVARPVDIYVEAPDRTIHQLHASMAIGERILRDTLWADTLPAWRWGNHVDWIANEAKLDSRQPQSATFSARLFPASATEFQIRRSRFPGNQWRIRVDVGSFPGTEGTFVLPRDASRDPATWAVLQLD